MADLKMLNLAKRYCNDEMFLTSTTECPCCTITNNAGSVMKPTPLP